ncbi:YncE family protein [Nonomuraea turcica]|uniref:YncE family protein n=1 Tax=Nonomuraea sp. G32 TaxID=3067274 RepID=UPI00273AEC26|nr:YncE family protein [Nonomuraea sp. G32]MDP4510311.1 YncE family protein [Nonomuraea sp. G32]
MAAAAIAVGLATLIPLTGVPAPAVAQVRQFAYVANSGSGTVSVINTATNTVIDTIPVGAQPAAVAITPNGTRAYVANFNSSNVSMINTATNTVIDTIPVGALPFGVAITPNGTRAYVANFGSNNVSMIDTATNTVIGAPITVGNRPVGVAIARLFNGVLPGPPGRRPGIKVKRPVGSQSHSHSHSHSHESQSQSRRHSERGTQTQYQDNKVLAAVDQRSHPRSKAGNPGR